MASQAVPPSRLAESLSPSPCPGGCALVKDHSRDCQAATGQLGRNLRFHRRAPAPVVDVQAALARTEPGRSSGSPARRGPESELLPERLVRSLPAPPAARKALPIRATRALGTVLERPSHVPAGRGAGLVCDDPPS